MIERWFPCAEVTANSKKGWGSGRSEKTLFTWFAARPLAQAKAAVICSLLPWPDEAAEQERLCGLVRRAMEGRDAAHGELVEELARHYPDGASLLDSFSGRAMIPLEAARLGVKAWGIDYSPVATLAGTLLADYPLRDWSGEPPLPFDGYEQWATEHFTEPRLLRDVGFVLNLVGERYEAAMDRFYPVVDGKRPWGYLWAVTVPCVNCGRRFPLVGNLQLRRPDLKNGDPGQSYRIVAGGDHGGFRSEVHDGPPSGPATLVKVKGGGQGRAAVCCLCDHVHPFDVHTRLMADGLAEDSLLVVADLDERTRRRYRAPATEEFAAIETVVTVLESEPEFGLGLPAVPDERAVGITGGSSYARYGYRTFGDCCNARQTLGFVRLARIINDVAAELRGGGGSCPREKAECLRRRRCPNHGARRRGVSCLRSGAVRLRRREPGPSDQAQHAWSDARGWLSEGRPHLSRWATCAVRNRLSRDRMRRRPRHMAIPGTLEPLLTPEPTWSPPRPSRQHPARQRHGRAAGGPVAQRSRYRPAVRRHGRLLRRLGHSLCLAEAGACDIASVVRHDGAPRWSTGKDRRGDRQAARLPRERPSHARAL